MGIWIAFTFEFIVRIRLMRHIMRLNKNRTKKVLSLTLLFVIASVICLVTLLGEWFLYYYAINRPNHEFNVPPVWEQMVHQKCGIPEQDVIYIFAKNSIPDFGEIGLPYGAYIGTLL